jgi:ornithine cyclodeaminase
MDGTVISAMRTGAATGVAAKYLARRDATVLALIGAGVQNRTQLMALNRVLPNLAEVRVFDIKSEKAQLFCQAMKDESDSEFRVTSSAREAVKGADVFVTATVSSTPYVQADWIEEGVFQSEVSSWDTHITALAAYDKIVVDDWKTIKHGKKHVSGRAVDEGVIIEDRIYAELGTLVVGKKPGRETDSERILFNPIGMSILDVSEAARIYHTAKESDIGQEIRLWNEPVWV